MARPAPAAWSPTDVQPSAAEPSAKTSTTTPPSSDDSSRTDSVWAGSSNEAANAGSDPDTHAATAVRQTVHPGDTARPRLNHPREARIVSVSNENAVLTGGIGHVGHPAAQPAEKFRSDKMRRLYGHVCGGRIPPSAAFRHLSQPAQARATAQGFDASVGPPRQPAKPSAGKPPAGRMTTQSPGRAARWPRRYASRSTHCPS